MMIKKIVKAQVFVALLFMVACSAEGITGEVGSNNVYSGTLSYATTGNADDGKEVKIRIRYSGSSYSIEVIKNDTESFDVRFPKTGGGDSIYLRDLDGNRKYFSISAQIDSVYYGSVYYVIDTENDTITLWSEFPDEGNGSIKGNPKTDPALVLRK